MTNRIKMIVVLFGVLKFTILHSLEEPSAYESIRKLFPYSESEYFQNRETLKILINSHSIQSIIQVGCWYGKSTIYMAEQLPNNGKIYAIDSWIGYPREIYKNTFHVYERFLSNVVLANLSEKIVPIRATSLTASRFFSKYRQSVDMIYIDADHSYCSVYSDIIAWSKYLNKGGILCGNLYSKHGNTKEIKRAVLDYCKAHHKEAYFNENLWEIR